MTLAGERIILGVSGGIAAYKAPDLVRRLRERGAEVRVVLTRGAEAFITPLTFQAVSHQPVHSELLDPEAEAGMGHLELARWADRVLIAPASADLIARLAAGLADDLLTTLCLATEAPLVVCPAMNHIMWQAPATQANTQQLMDRSVTMLGPETGELAEGESGPGRLMEPSAIVSALEALPQPAASTALAGRSILVTAGPTHEPIDPVRFIANRSSGRMGFAIAAAAREAGASVTLVAGPSALATPRGVERIDVETANQMHDAVMDNVGNCAVLIAAAAVADYRLEAPSEQKIKKSAQPTTLALVPNPDIVTAVAELADGPFTVGFAAETESALEHARDKRLAKGLDMIAANTVGPGQGFDVDDNCLTVLWGDQQRTLGPAAKTEVAKALIELIGEQLDAAG
jgi:phosphopantothenoylcysteine decarboxylase/phosphopantothenate--cysteine ligase